MLRNRIAGVLSVFVLALAGWGQAPVTTGTYAVGTCKPGLPSYSTISAALAATPAPSTVLVCPGTYVEQIMITQPVNLQGVTSGGSGQVMVQLPGGYVTSVYDDRGAAVGAQLFVIDASGPVTVSDITFDGSNGGAFFGAAGGVFFQNSSGTLNRVTVVHDNTQFAGDYGVYINGGASNPSVTVQNSSIHDVGQTAIHVETSVGTINATIKGNYISANAPGVFLDIGGAATVMNNVIQGGGEGVTTDPGAAGGSISGNTIVASNTGIDAESDAVSVTNNKILASNFVGINAFTTSATIQGNTIVGAPIGIDFECSANPNVKSNTISEVGVGLNNVASGAAPANNYFNVGTIRNQGKCPGAR